MIEELPQSWQKVELAHICELVNGDRGKNYPSKDKLSKEGLPFVNAGNLKNNRILNESMNFIDEHRFNLLNSGKFGIGDILFCIRGSLGKVALNIHIESGAIASSLIIVRPHQFIMQKYVLYYLTSPLTHNMINKFDNGTAQPNLAGADLGRFEFPLPPLNEQKRIVAKIEELFSELDKGIESLKTAREQLKGYRQAVLKHAFEGKLTADFRHGKPPAWATLSVSQLLNQPLCNGRSVKDRIGGFPVLRLTALKGGRIDLAESKEGDWNREDALPVLVSSGDFFVARGNGSKHLVGMGGLVPEVTKEVAFPDTMIRLRLKTACVDPRYFALCWNSRIVRQQIERDARTTAGIYKINQDHISQFTLPVPPIEEQRVIVSRVEEKLSEAESAIEQLSNDLQRGAALRQSILKKAFSGKLVAQDLDDEPASVLLERIRAEKEAQSGKREPKQKREVDSIFELAAIQTGVVQTCFWP